MISVIVSRIVILTIGTLYPAYASFKAVRTKNVKEYVKWMMYWIVFALFTFVETFADMFVAFWLPFYYEIKIVFVLWLLSPATKGASILYRKYVHPHLIKREQDIDTYIAQASDRGYSAVLDIGSKGISYATNVVLATAMKGQSKIAEHIKKSYSVSDVSVDQPDGLVYGRGGDNEDMFDDDEEMDNRLIHERYEREMAELRGGGGASPKKSLPREQDLDMVGEETVDDPNTRPVRPKKALYSHKEASHIGTLPRSRSTRTTRPTIMKS